MRSSLAWKHFFFISFRCWTSSKCQSFCTYELSTFGENELENENEKCLIPWNSFSLSVDRRLSAADCRIILIPNAQYRTYVWQLTMYLLLISINAHSFFYSLDFYFMTLQFRIDHFLLVTKMNTKMWPVQWSFVIWYWIMITSNVHMVFVGLTSSLDHEQCTVHYW